VGPQQQTYTPPANCWWCIRLARALRHVRAVAGDGDMFLLFLEQKQSSQGRKYLVEYAQSALLYLVTHDRKNTYDSIEGRKHVFISFLEIKNLSIN